MFQASEIKALIEKGLPCEHVVIEGDDGVHFSGIVVSATFEGKLRVRQHQAVYATLGPLMGNETAPRKARCRRSRPITDG